MGRGGGRLVLEGGWVLLVARFKVAENGDDIAETTLLWMMYRRYLRTLVFSL